MMMTGITRDGFAAKCAVGLAVRVAHNVIHDMPRCGIFHGGALHTLEYNRIDHCNLEIEGTGCTYTGGWRGGCQEPMGEDVGRTPSRRRDTHPLHRQPRRRFALKAILQTATQEKTAIMFSWATGRSTKRTRFRTTTLC